jgi:cbb3-type cytochrome c oxidase subunit III
MTRQNNDLNLPEPWRAGRPLLDSGAQLIALALAALALLFSVAASAATQSRSKQDPAAIYHNYCSVCHGDRGDGRSRAAASLSTPPRNFTAPGMATILSADYMTEVIRNGRPGTAMVGWKRQLTDAQIRAVAEYVRAAFVVPASSPIVRRGRDIYQANCAACHGDQGQGNAPAPGALPARDFRTPQAASELTRERMTLAVLQGRPGTAMTGFGERLSREDIDAVIEYVRAAIMMPAPTGISGASAHAAGELSAAIDTSLPLPQRLRGDAVKGRAFYLANCATCHGDSGDGKGPRAHFIRPSPRVLTDAAARAQFNRPALYLAIAEGRPGSEMPAWNKVLTPQEIANVAEFVFQNFIRPPERR